MKEPSLFPDDLQEKSQLSTMSREDLERLASYQKEAIVFWKKAAQQLEAQFTPKAERLALHDQLVILKKKFYGRSSEKRSAGSSSTSNGKPSPSKGPRILLPSEKYPDLPLVEEESELETLPSCRLCQGEMQKMNQTENAEFIQVTQKTYHICLQKRHKYRCGKCHGDIVTTPAKPRMRPGSQYSDEVAIDVAVAKYADHLPIERYVRQAERAGLQGISPQTLIQQTHYLAERLRPVYDALRQEIQKSPVLRADETPWKMLEGDDRKTWFMWGFFNEKNSYYQAERTRATEVAESFLKHCQAEVLLTDAYSGYTRATRDTEIRNAFCHAHARRKFIEAEINYAEQSEPMIEWYQKLFHLEKIHKHDPPEVRLQIRQEQSEQILKEMKAYCFNLQVLPQSSIGKARNYFLKYYEGLKIFLSDVRVPMDNNLSERGLRGIVLGRKNYYGNHSKKGAQTTATLYSIIESCKLNGVQPFAYLQNTLQAILNDCPFKIPVYYRVSA